MRTVSKTVGLSLTTMMGLLFAMPASALAKDEIELPEFGTKRRVVMAEMRIAGANLLDSSGDRLDFLGGPAGLPEASTSSFSFNDSLELVDANVLFPRLNSRSEMNRRFRQLRGRLTRTCGKAQQSKGLVATWTCKEATIELRADAHGDTELTLTKRHQQRELAESGSGSSTTGPDATDEVAVWSPGFFQKRTTETKRAVESLLHDLGNQKFLRWGYRKKGSPLGLRLRTVVVPKGIDGVDRDLLKVRFLYFIRGNWDVDVARNRRQTDVELDMRIVETHETNPGYAIQLTARAAQGKARGKVLYSRAQRLTL